jgi:flagellar hook-basal body complex protein FliE|tara:strand:- start:467 stop:694 length:228 start_codon:yes stop_codon:yes gene_type:complete
MDIKSMLVKLAEEQAHKMQEEAMGHLRSDEFSDMLATKINEKIDIPFVSEEKEQVFFERVMDIVTDVMEGVFKGK